MENTVLLPQNIIEQKLDRNKLNYINNLIKIYQDKLVSNNKNNEEFIIADGPPYANGSFHAGHALNKVLKDFFVKYYLLKGYDVKFKTGWDCHGLPIENRAKKEYPEKELFEACKEIAFKYKNIQEETLNKFGIYTTDDIYMTLSDDFVSKELEIFNNLKGKGYIVKRDKPTWYSPTLGTVLANSEIEYKDITDESLYFYFDSVSELNYKFLIWTTTEWTVPGNQAISMNPNIQYVYTKPNYEFNNSLICSKNYADKQNLDYVLINFEDIPKEYNNYNNELCRVIIDETIDETIGTGIVHLCGGHGDEDFEILLKNGITPKNVYDKDKFLEHINTFKMNKNVYYREQYTHSYPIDWREKNKVYKFLTEQTYLDFDLQKIKTALKQIKLSSKDRNKLEQMVFSRKDWCISRQRKWGVQIPETNDILDVWFDSGCVWSLYDKPADIYLEGVDQYRGWFQSSLILAAMNDKIPTKRIISHGFIKDDLNNKLSKSSDNYQSLEELYDKYNPDVLRLWIFLSDYKNDVIISDESLANAGKQYFKIRNYLRYFRNNIYNNIEYIKTLSNDVNLEQKFNNLESKVQQCVNEFDLTKAIRLIINELNLYSSTLSEDIKNKFYESDKNQDYRLKYEKQFLMNIEFYSKLLFPFMPFLILEIKETIN